MNEIINKRAAGIIWKCKNLLHLLKKIENKYLKDKRYRKVKDHCHYTGEQASVSRRSTTLI